MPSVTVMVNCPMVMSVLCAGGWVSLAEVLCSGTKTNRLLLIYKTTKNIEAVYNQKRCEVNDYKKLKAKLLKLIERDWGQRCETKDYEDFPELKGGVSVSEGRCPACLTYEKFDEFWRYIERHTDN